MAELLLDRGYDVTGLIRRPADGRLGAAEHLRGRVDFVQGDLLEPEGLVEIVAKLRPDELYHLAAPSFVPRSWERPADTLAAIAGAAASILEAVRDHSPHTRLFVAATGGMFGATSETPQREDTPFRPQNPYATAKLTVHQLVGQLRAHAGVFACSGILYNHESERRPESFVSRKITRGAAAIKLGFADKLILGDLRAVRDWSFAGDIMQGAWLMLQQPTADDYILASGTARTVEEFAEVAFSHLGLDAHRHIRVDRSFMRAPEPTPPVGDARQARERLRWRPALTFEQLVRRMVDADLKRLQEPGGRVGR
jgi:GDPmannose 4,6-dehydratase